MSQLSVTFKTKSRPIIRRCITRLCCHWRHYICARALSPQPTHVEHINICHNFHAVLRYVFNVVSQKFYFIQAYKINYKSWQDVKMLSFGILIDVTDIVDDDSKNNNTCFKYKTKKNTESVPYFKLVRMYWVRVLRAWHWRFKFYSMSVGTYNNSPKSKVSSILHTILIIPNLAQFYYFI